MSTIGTMAVSTKPPIIQVLTDSLLDRSNCIGSLQSLVQSDRYIISDFDGDPVNGSWSLLGQRECILLVVIGEINTNVYSCILDFVKNGGNVFSICSNLFRKFFPECSFTQVSDQKLVQITYKTWRNVSFKHHQLCYRQPNLQTYPNTVILATEQTWDTPSMMYTDYNKGRIFFSQLHLELDPFHMNDNTKIDDQSLAILRTNDLARLQIFRDILNCYFGICVKHNLETGPVDTLKHGFNNSEICYLFGTNEIKQDFLKITKPLLTDDDIFKNSKMAFKLVTVEDDLNRYDNWSDTLKPLIINDDCHTNFSTLRYFDVLKTAYIGRLVLFAEVISTTMDVFVDYKLINGIAAIASHQTKGKGRVRNQWISPKGSASVTLQLHIDLQSPLGQRLSLLQNIVAVAIIATFRTLPGFDNFPLFLKWPNDICTKDLCKVGGMLIETTILNNVAVCLIGVGLNVDNDLPTISVNSLIRDYCVNVKPLELEDFYALFFNQLELMLESINQDGDFDTFYELYYKYWLHENQTVTVLDRSNQPETGKIVGIDNYGFLRVRVESSGELTSVHPDGNSFDMLHNIIISK